MYSNLSRVLLLVLSCLMCNCCWLALCTVIVVLHVLLLSYVYLFYCVCIVVFNLDAGLLTRSQYSEGPATGHLDTGFSWFPCVYKQMLRWFPTFQVATTCFSYSPPNLNLLVTNFIFCIHVKYPLPPGDNPIGLLLLLLLCDRLLPHTFQFILHQSTYRSMLYIV